MKIKHLPILAAVHCCWIIAGFARDTDSVVMRKAISQYTHEIWTTDNGLPQNSINAIVQTPDGYLWIGTQEGLVRFDGVRFTVFDKSNTAAINNNYITSLSVDRSGVLWIGTYEGGIAQYSKNTFSSLAPLPDLSNCHVRSVFKDSRGIVWIAARERGVIRVLKNSYEIIDTTNGLNNGEAWCFSEDSVGNVWIGTEKGICIYQNGKFQYFNVLQGLLSDYITALLSAPDNRMWIGTNRGIMNVPLDLSDKKSFRTYTTANGLPNKTTYSMQQEKNGDLWIGTRGGLARLFNNTFSTFTVANGLSYDHVSAIYIDRENNIWVGTDGGGLEVFRNGPFTTYTAKEGLPSNIIWTVFEDQANNKWVGTDAGLLKMNDENLQLTLFSKKDGLYDDEVYTIAEDKNGTMWIGTVNGINRIVNGKVEAVAPIRKTQGMIASSIIVDSKNRVWAATSGSGVFKFENGNLSAVTTADGLVNNYTSVLLEDAQGNVWVGTDGEGLSVISDKGIVSYSMKDGLSSNFVHSFLQDREGTIWIGTFGGGLTRYKEGKFKSITSKQGLFDDVLFQILEDDFDRLWMTSNKGIFRADKKYLNDCADGIISSVPCIVYGKESGLKSTECNGGVQPAGWKARNGSLWFPTSYGLATIDPKQMVSNNTPPSVIIESFISDNRSIPIEDHLVVPSNNNHIEIHFTGLSFLSPSKIKFKVKMEGYDKEWENIDTRRTAYYTNLPSGTYTFHVIAANGDGIWNTTGASLAFVRQGYFYETKIFYFGLFAIILTASYGMYHMRVRHLRKREFDLQRLVDERTFDLQKEQARTEELLHEAERQRTNAVAANALKTQLIDMVAHHLKSPLVSMKGLTNELEQSTTLNNLGMKYLKMMRFGVDRMINVINDLLNLSIIESGEIGFHFEKNDLSEIAGLVVDSYKFQAQKKGQSLTYVADEPDTVSVMVDTARMQEAIENLISNAIKYSFTDSVIRAGVYRHDGVVRFWITDYGPGISQKDQERLFKKFQVLSAKPTGNEVATGLGLAIVKEIIDRHKGNIYVKSELGHGSTFIIELPAV